MRSAGIRDLRHGNVRDSSRQDAPGDARADARRPLPLPASVRAYAIATTTQETAGGPGAMRGDGLVPIASALGDHPDPAFDLRIPPSRRWIGHGINHLQMLRSEAVCQRIAEWLREPV
jgi:hypothetical protein